MSKRIKTQNRFKRLILVLLFLMVILLSQHHVVTAEESTAAEISVESIRLEPNGIGEAVVKATRLPEPGLAGYQCTLNFDPGVISVIELINLQNGWTFFYNDQVPGEIKLISASAHGVTGEHDLFKIRVQAKGILGQIYPLTLNVIPGKFLDETLTAQIPYSIVQGRVNIEATPISISGATENDVTNTFGWNYPAGFTKPADFEYSTDNGLTWSDVITNPQPLANGDYEIGAIQVRIKADPTKGRGAGPALLSQKPYTRNPDSAAAPTILTQPREEMTMKIGDTAELSIMAQTDKGTLSYQWYSSQVQTTTGGALIVGVSQATYAVPTTSAGITYYHCIVTNTDQSAILNTTANTVSQPTKVTVKAITPANLTVTYLGNRETTGTVPVDSQTYGVGDRVTLADNTGNLTRDGYRFGGWNTHPRGFGTSYVPGSTLTMGVDNVTLYADWIVDECFIATAAYGSKYAEPVAFLRKFRDEQLLRNPLGQAFVSFYYKTSPTIARFIASSEALKAIVRLALIPFIISAYLLMNPTLGIGIVLALVAGWTAYRKRREFKGAD